MTRRSRTRLPAPVRAILVIGLLYFFLVGVKLLEGGIKALGSDLHQTLFEGVTNPIAGLCVGILGTVLVQSSSVTTTTIVGLVAAGVISVEHAVPMVMGANIGTTVTNTLVAVAHMRRSEEFRRAFTGATMHDFFNLAAVIVLLPVQVTTKVLSRLATSLTDFVSGGEGLGGTFNSPVNAAVKSMAGRIEEPIHSAFSGTAAGITILAAGLVIIFLTLALITSNMKTLVATRIEVSLNAALARSGFIGMVVGMVVTMAVQSSSITTSILIPLVASGVLAIPNAYPITLGANVGTTITALLAALGTGSVDALTIAVTHTLFNVIGILIFYPWKPLRRLPVFLAGKLADLAIARRRVAFIYLGIVFLLMPIIGIVIFG